MSLFQQGRVGEGRKEADQSKTYSLVGLKAGIMILVVYIIVTIVKQLVLWKNLENNNSTVFNYHSNIHSVKEVSSRLTLFDITQKVFHLICSFKN